MPYLLFIGLCLQAFVFTSTVSARSAVSFEELADDSLVPVNVSSKHEASISVETSEVEGSGSGEIHPIPPIPAHLENIMERMQVEEPVDELAKSKELVGSHQGEEKENVETHQAATEGSGAYEHEEEGPRSAAMIANIEDPFTREEGMEDVYKELVGEEPAQTDDDNMQDNTLSVIADDSLVKPAESESLRNEESRELKVVPASGEEKEAESAETHKEVKEVEVNEEDAEGGESKKSEEVGGIAPDPVVGTQEDNSEKEEEDEKKSKEDEAEEKVGDSTETGGLVPGVVGENSQEEKADEEVNSNPEETSSEKSTNDVSETEIAGNVEENISSKEKSEEGNDSSEKSSNLVVPTSGESDTSSENVAITESDDASSKNVVTTEQSEESSESVTTVPVIVIPASQDKEDSGEKETSGETDVVVDNTSVQTSNEDKNTSEVQEEVIVKENVQENNASPNKAIDLPPIDLSNETVEGSSEVPETVEETSEVPPTTESSEVEVPIPGVDDAKSKESSEETATDAPKSDEDDENSMVVPDVVGTEEITTVKLVDEASESPIQESKNPELNALPGSELASSPQPPEVEEEEDTTAEAPQEELVVPPVVNILPESSTIETPSPEKPTEPEETTGAEAESTTDTVELIAHDMSLETANVNEKILAASAEGAETKRMGAYIFIGVIGVCFIALIIFLVARNRMRYRGRHVVNNEDSEKALMSMGKFKDDSDDNNVKNNEITPLVIKQNSQINKFEKNPNFSSPKNLNTTANEKNVEKDNVLKSTTQAIIEDEVEDEKKSAEGEKGVDDEKNALVGGDSMVPEKLIVRTHLDQDSIPRKAIIVTRNGNGYHPVTQDPV